jgi:hypothetical protein
VKLVREGERRSRRKLGLAPEFMVLDLTVHTRRPRVLIQAPQSVPVIQTPLSVPVEPTTPERPRELVVTPVARPVASSPTPGVHSADVDDEAMAAIGQGVVGVALCRFGGGGSRACLGGHRHPSCSCCPWSPERLESVVFLCCSCCW